MKFIGSGIEREVAWCFVLCASLAVQTPAKSIAMGAAQAALASNSTAGSTAKSADGARADDASGSKSNRESYVIGPGDMLAVNVWKDPELSRTMPVRPDGHISLPLIGEVPAAGLTAAQLQHSIVGKLTTYMSHPEVSVSVQEIKSRKFNVVGRVMKAGEYDLTRPMTVLDAIALAGGFQDFARVKKIYILRPVTGGSPAVLPFNYKKVIKGESPSQNVQLQPGDTVVVP